MVEKKRIVRTGALVMAAALTLSMGMPVFAAAPVGAASEVKSVSVTNVDGAAGVTAYRIVEPTFDAATGYWTGYKLASGVTVADIEAPTSKEITDIVKAIKAGSLSLTSVNMTISGKNASGDLGAGEWIILVDDTVNADYIYNPMVVSVQYDDMSDASVMTAKGVDATGSYAIGTEGLYAKRTTIPLDKTIVSPDGAYAVDTDMSVSVSGADELQAGDTGHFQIASQIPAYSEAYTDVSFVLSDTQDDGFDAPTNIKVMVDGQQAANSAEEAAVVIQGNDFTVTFGSAFALANAGKDVLVTYDAKLNSNAKMGFESNDDAVKLTYTNDLSGHTTEKEDKIKEYSFKLDGELIKVEKDNSPSIDGYVPLAGATFTLTRQTVDGDHVAPKVTTVTTGADGSIKFDHLDEGVYTLRETEAPRGYSVNDTEYTVTITPTYDGTGKDAVLVSYKVNVSYTDAQGQPQSVDYVYDNNMADAGSAGKEAQTSTQDKGGKKVISTTNAVQVIDVKIANLPSTGREGTFAFAIVGAGIMSLAVIILMKKKKELVR